MNLEHMDTKKKLTLIFMLLIPLIISVVLLVYLKVSWQVEVAPGERYSPINNRPLFVGLLLFTLGYLFFLGILFSENFLELLNRRRSAFKR